MHFTVYYLLPDGFQVCQEVALPCQASMLMSTVLRPKHSIHFGQTCPRKNNEKNQEPTDHNLPSSLKSSPYNLCLRGATGNRPVAHLFLLVEGQLRHRAKARADGCHSSDTHRIHLVVVHLRLSKGQLPQRTTAALLFNHAGWRRLHQNGKEIIGSVVNIILPNPDGKMGPCLVWTPIFKAHSFYYGGSLFKPILYDLNSPRTAKNSTRNAPHGIVHPSTDHEVRSRGGIHTGHAPRVAAGEEMTKEVHHALTALCGISLLGRSWPTFGQKKVY